tara:strand:+ start:862 stop:1293 length:432 start_codon:yes stop_codon:yes gene_type:complete
MSYIGNAPGVASQRLVYDFTATSGQTTFTPEYKYTIGYVDVYLNGVRLVNEDDYTATNGTTIVLGTGASAGDSVCIVAYIPRGLIMDNGAVGGAGNYVFWENDQVVSVNYTITSGKNAGSFGPVTVNSGVTVTIPSNSTWTIV